MKHPKIYLLLILITLAGAVFQWPLGYISDKMDRRKVLLLSATLGIVFCIMSILFSGTSLLNAFTQNLTKFNYFSTALDKGKLFLFVTLLAGRLGDLSIGYLNKIPLFGD